MKSLALIGTLLLLAGCEYSYKMGNNNNAQIGRYQIVESDGITVLIDTTEGKTWRWVYAIDENSPTKEVMSRFWEPSRKFDTTYEAETWVTALQEGADQARASKGNWRTRAKPVE